MPYNRYLAAFLKFVSDVTDPYLNLFRRILPPVRMGPGALDLSPIVATFVLIIVSSIVVGLIRPGELRGRAAAIATAGIVVALDQATKQLAVANIDRGDHVNVFFGLDDEHAQHGRCVRRVRGRRTRGRDPDRHLAGAAGGLLPAAPRHAAAVAPGRAPARRRAGQPRRPGARRRVIDFIDPVAWPAFNLADACIVVGVVMLLCGGGGPRRAPTS